jgi:hypothetical protein
MFFADGDFQSTKLWQGNPVIGNVARIYYGQAQNSPGLPNKDRILARRQHISTADESIAVANRWPDPTPAGFAASFNTANNDSYEYDWVSLSQWQAIANDPLNASKIVNVCFSSIGSRPAIDLANSSTLHLLMAEGVGSFSVQWSYPYTDASGTHIYWWPSIDPDGNGDFSDSDFGTSGINRNLFGFYFNTAASSFAEWFTDSYAGTMGSYYPTKPSYPNVLKFTFTIYDSRGVFKEGQTFTHIVYIGD